ncbi:Uu.00g102480.m01.CDS01 [Anthostomella pinea]|uniref:Uu.00g102480.m01.CDS01 n=1 Tax=Anthostomella pinea TaxID=933095 RepID=A0AAI8V897_9PEZI|nr:Uu.00g102480.m01.CDS01 [Anthostomella pinea]
MHGKKLYCITAPDDVEFDFAVRRSTGARKQVALICHLDQALARASLGVCWLRKLPNLGTLPPPVIVRLRQNPEHIRQPKEDTAARARRWSLTMWLAMDNAR